MKVLKECFYKIRPVFEKGYVLMLHRVDYHNRNNLTANEKMKISPMELDHFIKKNKDRYRFLSVGEVNSYLLAKDKKKFIVFTLDDGYKDNLSHALPVFKQNNVPFTIFITSCFPNMTADLWWYQLEKILLDYDSIRLADGSEYTCRTFAEKNEVFSLIRNRILSYEYHQYEAAEKFLWLFDKYRYSFDENMNEKLCLNWSEIRKLLKEPLVTIGSHTAHHSNLKKLASAMDVRDEIQSCIDDFMEKSGYKPEYFAYPFGTKNEYGRREMTVLKELGIKGAFAGCGHGITKFTDPFGMPRICACSRDFQDSGTASGKTAADV